MDTTRLSERLGLETAFDTRLFEIAGTPITVATLITLAAIVLFTFLASWLIQRGLARFLKVRGVVQEGTVAVAQRLVHYLVLVIGLSVGLETVGINLAALFAAGALFAVGLGFAMQNIAQNFVSGVILLIERSIKPGDVLRVEDRFVKVSRMGIRATHARTLDDEEIIVPNSNIVQSIVTNYTLMDSLYRLRCAVGVVYSSDMAVVRKTLEDTAGALEWRSREHEPVILMTAFGNSSVDFEVSVWIEEPWSYRRRLSDLHEAVWWALKEADVTIAFPQLDLHLDRPVVESLQAMRRAG